MTNTHTVFSRLTDPDFFFFLFSMKVIFHLLSHSFCSSWGDSQDTGGVPSQQQVNDGLNTKMD